jgi:hypothetical protein
MPHKAKVTGDAYTLVLQNSKEAIMKNNKRR